VPEWIKGGIEIREGSFSRLLRALYSPDISPCDFWPFDTLKGILKDRELNSNDEIEEAIASGWNDLAFDDFQCVFHTWMNRLGWVIKNGGSYTLQSIRNNFLMFSE
jgi:hypothetical protein